MTETVHKIKKKKTKHSGTALLCIGIGFFLLICITGVYLVRITNGIPAPVLGDDTISFTGHDGSGKVVEDFHPERLLLDTIDHKISVEKEEGRTTAVLQQLKKDIVCGFDRSSNLSNGDVITYACTIDSKLARDAGLKITDTQKSYRVEGLAAYTHIDPFANLTSTWDLSNEQPVLTIIPPASIDPSLITYTCEYDPNTGLYTIHAQAEEAKLQEAGILLTSTTTTYDPGPAPVLVNKVKELSSDEVESLWSQASSLLQDELTGCNHILHGTDDTLTINDFTQDTIRSRHGTFQITFQLQTEGSKWADNPFFHTNVSYNGKIWRNNGQITFITQDKHSCTVEGPFGLYDMPIQN